jgi:hypothetical protein
MFLSFEALFLCLRVNMLQLYLLPQIEDRQKCDVPARWNIAYTAFEFFYVHFLGHWVGHGIYVKDVVYKIPMTTNAGEYLEGN